MMFNGMIAGRAGVVLADSGATATAYISAEYCEHQNISIKRHRLQELSVSVPSMYG
jgi:hypothetical protein